jgi:hypothetical protein
MPMNYNMNYMNYMNYTILADCLWYFGHVLTGCAIVVNHYNYSMGILCVFIGQFTTIISRPIGRINNSRPSGVLVLQ